MRSGVERQFLQRFLCIVTPLFSLAAQSWASSYPPPNPLPPDVIQICNLAQTFCAVSDPRIALTRVIRAGSQEPSWSVPGYFRHFLVSNGGGTVAVFAPVPSQGSAETPFLTLHRKSGNRTEFGYWALYPNLLQSPGQRFSLSWGSLFEINAEDQIAVRSVRGEVFKFSMKDED